MNLKEIEKKKILIEKEILTIAKAKADLEVEIAVFEAQAKLKSNNIIDLEEKIALLKSEKKKLEFAEEVIKTPATQDEEPDTPKPQYEDFKPNHQYKVGDIFKVEKRLYQVIQFHTSDEKFNKLLTNKYQLIDNDTLKPILNYSITKTYNKNDKVLYDDNIYVSKIDNNNLSPKSSPQNWLKLDI